MSTREIHKTACRCPNSVLPQHSHVMSRDRAKTLGYGIARFSSSLDQVVQQGHQYLHLSAGVSREDRRQTARRGRDAVLDHGGQAVHAEDDLISGTRPRIEVQIVTGINQTPLHEAVVRRDQDGQRHDRVVGHAAGVQEDDAQRGESATYQRVSQHHPAVILMPHDPPVVLDVLDASADRCDARPHEAIFDCGSQAEADRPEQLDLHVDVLLAQESVRAGGYEHEAQHGEAREDQR